MFPAVLVGDSEHVARRRLELLAAMQELEDVRSRVDAAAHAAHDRIPPINLLVLVLPLLSGGVVFAVALQSLRWFWALALGIVATAITFFVLMMHSFHVWHKEHPLLMAYLQARLMKGKRVRSLSETADLSAAIVRSYLPETESRPLLGELERAESKMDSLLESLEEERQQA